MAEAATVRIHSLTYALKVLCLLTYATYAQDLGFLQMTRTLQEASAAQEWKGARVEGGTLL